MTEIIVDSGRRFEISGLPDETLVNSSGHFFVTRFDSAGEPRWYVYHKEGEGYPHSEMFSSEAAAVAEMRRLERAYMTRRDDVRAALSGDLTPDQRAYWEQQAVESGVDRLW